MSDSNTNPSNGDSDESAPTTVVLTDAERQRIFRSCLEALARPGSLHHLEGGSHSPRLLPHLALTDLQTPVAALPGEAEPEVTTATLEWVAGLTRAPIVPVGEARWVLAGPVPLAGEWKQLSLGTHEVPQDGAMVVLAVEELREPTDDDAVCWHLAGPGVDGTRGLVVEGVDLDVLLRREKLVADYPCGFDLLLVGEDGRVAGLPRTTRVTLAAGPPSAQDRVGGAHDPADSTDPAYSAAEEALR